MPSLPTGALDLGDIPIVDIKIRLHVPGDEFQAVVREFIAQRTGTPRLIRGDDGRPLCDFGSLEVVALPDGQQAKADDDADMTVHVEGFSKLFSRLSRSRQQFIALPSRDMRGWSMVVREGNGCVVEYRQAAAAVAPG